MRWHIPAKTFLLGEYAALAEASAIIATTKPCFELSLTDFEGIDSIHAQSPAGLLWNSLKATGKGLAWYDPYQGKGGLGASSAQFLGCYLASCALNGNKASLEDLLSQYYQKAWSGSGLRPSGYDLIAQAHYGCVFINRLNKVIETYPWPFEDLSFFLIHTGKKLATHLHLQETPIPARISTLSALVNEARSAFQESNSEWFTIIINTYHEELNAAGLVAQHTLEIIAQLRESPEVLAMKGCGALGADIVLIITAKHDFHFFKSQLETKNHTIIATTEQLLTQNTLIIRP